MSCSLFTFSRVRDLTEFMMLHVISNLSSYLSFVFWGVVFSHLKPKIQSPVFSSVSNCTACCICVWKAEERKSVWTGLCWSVCCQMSSCQISFIFFFAFYFLLSACTRSPEREKNPYISSSILSFLSFYNIFRRTSDQIPIRSWLMNAFFITCMVNMFAFKHLALNGINSKSRELYL